MKRFLLIALMAIAAGALVAAPVWAAGRGRVMSDRQLDGIHAGDSAASADARGTSDLIGSASAASSVSTAQAAEASDVESVRAVDIDNTCTATTGCVLAVNQVNLNSNTGTQVNSQSIANTLVSTNAVQINVAGLPTAGTAGVNQKNKAFSTGKGIGEIDSADTARGSAESSAASDAGFNLGASVASAASATSASAATALAFATPRVEVDNRCEGPSCTLTIGAPQQNVVTSTGTVNAQSILNTLVSTNAIQMNVAGGATSGTVTQRNKAFSGGGL